MPPSQLHEKVISACSQVAWAFQSSMPEEYGSQITIECAKSDTSFIKPYWGSCKVPDMAVVVNGNNNEDIPRVVFEVGLSESYKHLKQSARLWVEGGEGVKECIIIKIHETQRYRSPSVDNIDFPADYPIKQSDFKSESEFGPVIYKGLRWTGTITAAFAETWTVNPLTKLATKSGKRIVCSYFYV